MGRTITISGLRPPDECMTNTFSMLHSPLTGYSYITEDTPPIISVQETKEDSTEPTEPTVQGEEKTGEETTKVHCNPLNWYGVLVPNTLKDTQKSFTRSVEQSIPDVLNATAKLRQIEIDIGRTRKTIKKLEKSEVLNSHTADAVAV
jgi:hypothetical protein